VGSTNTRPTVLDRLVCDREFSKVVANHLGFDLDLVELLAGVNTNDTANHFGDNDHVTKVCLDEIWFLVGFGLLLGLSQLLNQAHWFSLKTAVEPAASASVHDIPELFGGKVEELIKLDPTVGKLPELSLLLKFSGLLGVIFSVSHDCEYFSGRFSRM